MKEVGDDPAPRLRSLAAGYTDAIRVSDGKANIAILYGAFMMGSILGTYKSYPSYLPIELVMLPFMIVYLCMMLCLVPRYPRAGRDGFPISWNARAEDFVFNIDAAADLAQLKRRCAILSRLLFWKTLMLRIGFGVSVASTLIGVIVLLREWSARAP